MVGQVGDQCQRRGARLPQLPGVLPCPSGMNPASWMLDSLQGFDSTSGGAKAKPRKGLSKLEAKQAAVEATMDKKPPPAGDASQTYFFGSPLGAALMRTIAAESVPKLGQQKVAFDSVHARSFGVQIGALVNRGLLSYSRNVGLNFGRLFALTMLNLLFGTIWFGIARNATDPSGVQSLVSCIFMSAAFGAMVNMNTVVPALLGMRVVFYREQASAMYEPAAYQLATLLVEVPWLFGVLLVSSSIGYVMFGLVPAAYGFHLFACYVLALVYVSIGMWISAFAPTFEVAQAVLGLLGPLFFLFGGLWSPPPQMAIGARWFCYIDPITYAFKALIPQQFYAGSDGPGAASVILSGPTPICGLTPPGFVGPCTPDGSVEQGGAVILNGVTVFYMDRYAYVSQKYDVWFNEEWTSLGYLAIFIAVFQLLGLYGIKYIRHIVR